MQQLVIIGVLHPHHCQLILQTLVFSDPSLNLIPQLAVFLVLGSTELLHIRLHSLLLIQQYLFMVLLFADRVEKLHQPIVQLPSMQTRPQLVGD